MSTPKATVKRTPIDVHKVNKAVETLQTVVTTGTNCAAVQNAPVAKGALADLQTSLSVLAGNLTVKSNNLSALDASRKAVTETFADVEAKTRAYESSVNVIAAGNPATITAAGLLARGQKTPAAALGVAKDVKSKLGKALKETIVSWPEVPGARNYAVQVNANISTPAGPYTALPSGSSRRRMIMTPTPGAQILVQIAAIGSDGTQSAWCEPYLATAK
jgi:hypothetical protein